MCHLKTEIVSGFEYLGGQIIPLQTILLMCLPRYIFLSLPFIQIFFISLPFIQIFFGKILLHAHIPIFFFLIDVFFEADSKSDI